MDSGRDAETHPTGGGLAVSVVVPTRNRAEQLDRCLAALARIETTLPWEVVVVDNASGDATQEVLRHARDEGRLPLRTVVEPIRSNGRARNRGWRAARGTVIFYTDDDCYPRPDVLDRVWERFADDEELGYLGGRVLLHDPADDPVTTLTSGTPLVLQPYSVFPLGSLSGANMAFRRATLESIGGFDDTFGHGTRFSAPDPDAFARASFAGWRGAYDPGIVVEHHHGRKPGSEEVASLYKKYAIGRGAFYAKCVLDRRMRRPYLADWARWVRWSLRNHEFSGLRYEARGASAYLGQRIRAGARLRRGA